MQSATRRYPRDLHGYGASTPDPKWPDGAKIAVQFVLNYEEDGENCVLHGDAASEAFLSEVVGAQPWQGQRHWNMEFMYEYSARAGFWRLHRLFTAAGVPLTVYGVATVLELAPAHDSAVGLHNALARVFQRADDQERLDAAGRLTAEKTAKKAGAGLDHLTAEERADFAEACRQVERIARLRLEAMLS